MCKPGEDGGQIFKAKNEQIFETVHIEEHQQQENERMAPLEQTAVRQQRGISRYDRLFHRLKSLPPNTSVAGGAQPQEAKASGKERKRQQQKQLEAQHEEYKTLGQDLRLMTEQDVTALPLFRTEQGRKKWANEKLPHSKLTREQTLKQILNEGDYSNFENLDGVMRNLVASKALSKFMKKYNVSAGDNVEELCRRIKESGDGVSALLDPALRLALSLAQRTDGIAPEMKDFYQRLDEAMSTAVMESTLTHVADQSKVKDYFEKKGSRNPEDDAAKAIEANKAQQIQIAKRLLLMQLSNFHKIEDGSHAVWDKSMAVALSHCSRVVLTLPRQDGKVANDAAHQKEMWRSILTIDGKNTAQDNSRTSSTHSIVRRKAGISDFGSEEKKLPFNFIGQRGMNCAIGGLGNAGISCKTLCNDGSCGHFYSMYKQADNEHYGAMLMGLESDASGVTNQMGHTHDAHVIAEKASSLGGQRTDEVGDKYGGRQCDLRKMSAGEITAWMKALEASMIQWQNGSEGMSNADAAAVMKMLSGKKMSTTSDWDKMRSLLHDQNLVFPNLPT